MLNQSPSTHGWKNFLATPEFFGALGCVLLGMLSGYGMDVGPESWYSLLKKPSFNPPNWIFAPVWTILYLMLGVVLGKIWKNRKSQKWPLPLFLMQFCLNLSWSFLFFRMEAMDWALFCLMAMWIGTAALVLSVRNRTLALLLCPYWMWITFAGLLNAQLYLLNA